MNALEDNTVAHGWTSTSSKDGHMNPATEYIYYLIISHNVFSANASSLESHIAMYI